MSTHPPLAHYTYSVRSTSMCVGSDEYVNLCVTYKRRVNDCNHSLHSCCISSYQPSHSYILVVRYHDITSHLPSTVCLYLPTHATSGATTLCTSSIHRCICLSLPGLEMLSTRHVIVPMRVSCNLSIHRDCA